MRLTEIEQIESAKNLIQNCLERKPYELIEENIEKIDTSFIIEINERFNTENQILHQTALKFSTFLTAITQICQENEIKILHMAQQLQEKNCSIQSMNENILAFDHKIKSYQSENEKLKSQIILLSQRIEFQQKLIKKQRKQIKRTFKEVQQISEADRNLLQEMYDEKQALLIELKNQQKITADLNQEEKYLKHKIDELENIVKKLSIALNLEETKTCNFEQKNKQQNEKIQSLNEQIKKLRLKIPHLQQDEYNIKILNDLIQENEDQEQEDRGKSSFVRGVNLDDQIPHRFTEDFISAEFNRKTNEIRQSFQQNCRINYSMDKNSPEEEIEETQFTKNLKKMSMDPYFAHFILTSQAVKIKEDCEDLLNIDIKPYYKEIVEKRIPMHLWDQWIRNRLKEIFKKIKSKDEDF